MPKSTMLWQGLEHALECFVLNFDKVVEFIRWHVNETMCSISLRLLLTSSSKFSPILAIDNSHQWKPGEPLLDSKQLSWLRKIDSCSTISAANSTENALTGNHSIHYSLADDVVYTK